MPALVNRRFGESGIRLEEGTIVWPFDLKKSRNDRRISCDVIIFPPGKDYPNTGSRRVEVKLKRKRRCLKSPDPPAHLANDRQIRRSRDRRQRITFPSENSRGRREDL